ncbi:MAG: hypothetical protein JSW47_10880 [Phycisphaerales bacterium]|nr:MAG: hypothetical protein JSW47_10880 [Phycisphaerales bacterium]
MAKPEKKKSGFHKDISSVLKGVPIPQGVRNWRPHDRMDDSSEPELTNVSSVFKGADAEPDQSSSSSATPESQDHNAQASLADTTGDRAASRRTLLRKLDCPEDFSAKAEQEKQAKTANRTVYYRDRSVRTATPTVAEQLRKQLRDKSLRAKRVFGKKGRKALVLSAPVLIVIIILVYRYCFPATPQETEASASSGPPQAPASEPAVKDDVDWKVPGLLPAQMMDFLKDPEEQAEQKKLPEEHARGKGPIDLRAILFSDHRPSAVIGGRILHVGDRINNVTITNITKDSVEFEKDGKACVQKLHK